MKKYRVSALRKSIMSAFVEAENEDQALAIAKSSHDVEWESDGLLGSSMSNIFGHFDHEIDHSFDPEEVEC